MTYGNPPPGLDTPLVPSDFTVATTAAALLEEKKFNVTRNDDDDFYDLAVATRQDDDEQWSAFVRWVVWSTVVAEEREISSFDAAKLPILN